jgi:FkbM family methyltransferase
VVTEDAQFKKLCFNETHELWFPKDISLSPELWSEYLAVFWPHRTNGHYYLAKGTPITGGDICIDCGACEGFFVLQALNAGASKVICLEPNQMMAECLRRTFPDEIKAGRVVVVHAAAGAVDGFADFSFDTLQPFGGKSASGGSTVSVPMVTLSKLACDLNLERVDFIKMDIEGAEIQAVEGGLPVLMKHHPKLAITTYHRSFDYQALHALITAAGYRRIRPAGLTQRDDGIFRPMMLHAAN